MFSQLYDYCRWNWVQEAKAYLAKTPGITITNEDGICVRLAVSNNSPEMLELLFAYFKASLPQDKRAHEYAVSMQKMVDVFQEYIDFGDLSYDIINIIHIYLPNVVEKELIEAAEAGNTQKVKELYPYFPDITKDLLSVAVVQEQESIIDTLASIAKTGKKKAMVLCDAADLCANYNNQLEKISKYYEESIKACPDYFIAHLHYANHLQRQFCTDTRFEYEIAKKAELHYKIVIEHAPKYSCAYKKLGILYQIWSEHDPIHSKELAKKAFDSYVRAIEYKIEKLQYSLLYLEIEHLIKKWGDFELTIPINDTYLNQILKPCMIDLDVSSSSSFDDIQSILEEDIGYEEWDMDYDLESSLVPVIGVHSE